MARYPQGAPVRLSTTVRDLGNSGQFGDIALRSAITHHSIPAREMSINSNIGP